MSQLDEPPPPYYSATTSTHSSASIPSSTPSARPRLPSKPTPSIRLLLLGSPGVGKSTFLSQLPYVRDGKLQQSISTTTSSSPLAPQPSSITSHPNAANILTPNPATFNVQLFNRPYEITIHRSTSTLFVDPFPDHIDALLLAYAVDDRTSLHHAQVYWRRVFAERYERELGLEVPVMLIGLKRDLRTDAKTTATGEPDGSTLSNGSDGDAGFAVTEQDGKQQYVCVMPEEGLDAARKMRCDRYAECSAVTGELMWEVLEDITRMAALTTTDAGGFSSQDMGCLVS